MVHRIFFAINLPESLKWELGDFVERLKKLNKNKRIAWVSEENLHLTLHFLGNKTDEEIIKINEIAESVTKDFNSFEVHAGDFGCFPNQFRPRMVFLELRDTKILKNLVQKLGEKLLGAGFEVRSRPWRAHITVGRIKEDVKSCVFPQELFPETNFTVKSFELMESELTPQESVYRVLYSYKLKIVNL